jgi:hypothetical protein
LLNPLGSSFWGRRIVIDDVSITFEISKDSHNVIKKHIPHGLRKHAYRALLEGYAVKLEDNAMEGLNEVLAYSLHYQELIASGLRKLRKQ